MNKHVSRTLVLTAATLCLLGIGTIAVAGGSGGKTPGMSQTVDGYTLDLKLLPAEPFVGKADAGKPSNSGAMVDGGGAAPMHKSGPRHPNHHLVVFIKKNGAPVEHASVRMSYRLHGSTGPMVHLPVTRMWVSGAGPGTTHYGNNLNLAPGTYDVRVTVNGKARADFEVVAK